jgi:Membrane-bound metallopeptidase
MNAQINEVQVLEQNVIVAAFGKRGGTDELFERIAQEVRSHVPDVSTKKGRDAIGSLALKISKSKTLVEKCGKELVAEQKAQIKVIDDDRIAIVKKFDLLRDEILAPRDAWEQAEKDRVAQHIEAIQSIRTAAHPFVEETVERIKVSLSWVEQLVIDGTFEEYEQEAKVAKFEAIEALRGRLASREKYEAEQAELERLRKAEQKRLQREHEERIAREAAEKARIEAEQKAKAEADRVEREKQEAIAKAEREKRDAAEREARLVAEKEAAELRAQHAAEVERKRIEAEQAAKLEADRNAEEARLANRNHMKKINNEALSAMMYGVPGLTEEMAKELIRLIAKNEVPNISIKY